MKFDYKFVLIWTAVMGVAFLEFSWMKGTWHLKFLSLWLGLYVAIIPLGFLFAKQDDSKRSGE